MATSTRASRQIVHKSTMYTKDFKPYRYGASRLPAPPAPPAPPSTASNTAQEEGIGHVRSHTQPRER